MTDSLRITIRESADVVMVALFGELDLAGVAGLRRALLRAERHSMAIVLDLRELCFVDRVGLGPILEAARRARARRTDFAILSAPWPVHKVFCITGLDRDLPFLPTHSERRRAEIAEDMRDSVLQRLFAAQVHTGNVLASMETGDHTGARELTKAVLQEIGGAITELRAVVTGLS